MRLKFRAWDKVNKKWIYFFLPHGTFSVDVSPQLSGYPPDLSEWKQYTGLEDKHGKEIYEGDIVKINGTSERFIVKMEFGEWRIGKDNLYGYSEHFYGLTVIGNVYEYPELSEEYART